jgi:hypothetical protein
MREQGEAVPRPYARAATGLFVGATQCVALVQQGGLREQGEAVPRPYAPFENLKFFD